MEELKVRGIVLGEIDYKEKDRLLNIFTVEIGKITASIRGIKAHKSKLKIFAQPFCFAEFILVKTGEYYTVINANLIDDFINIVTDMDKYYIGNLLLELTNYTAKPGIISDKWFLNIVKILKVLVYENVLPMVVGIKIFLLIMKEMGEEWQFERCSICKSKYISEVQLDMKDGLVCRNCTSPQSLALSKSEFSALRIINNCDIAQLSSVKIKEEVLLNCLRALKIYFESQNGYKIRSLKQLV